MKKLLTILTALLLTIGMTACKDLSPVLDQVAAVLEDSNGSAISSEQMTEAIRQALAQGVNDSVNQLGSNNGFALSELYRISIPQSLQQPATILRQLGQGKRVDEFESRLNEAAEQSVAQATPIFAAAVRGMTVNDALSIMQGADNAATVYFRDKTEARLREQFSPIIQAATSQSGLSKSYKSLSNKIATYVPAYQSKLVDIDEYVLQQAMDSLFGRIAEEEKAIRENPAQRTTQLMKTVFGHFDRKKEI